MSPISNNPTLKQLQKHIEDICIDRGWDKNTHLEKFLLFSEEVGELAKAIRYTTSLYPGEKKIERRELEEEFADVLNYLLDLANHFDVDLEKAFREKDAVNKDRTW